MRVSDIITEHLGGFSLEQIIRSVFFFSFIRCTSIGMIQDLGCCGDHHQRLQNNFAADKIHVGVNCTGIEIFEKPQWSCNSI